MSAPPNSTDVVIVGAGPAGLALAGVLVSEGVSFVIVDRLAEGANTSRAVVVHARTLEVLEEQKVTDQLCAQGHIVPFSPFAIATTCWQRYASTRCPPATRTPL